MTNSVPRLASASSAVSPVVQGEQLKYKISEVALDLFLDHGFENVTVDAVASAVGVSRRTIFRHFPTKEEIPFPDHKQRLDLQRDYLASAEPTADPLDVVVEACGVVMRDFLLHEDLVLKRYDLTRSHQQVRERELVENARYTAASRSYLRKHLRGGPACKPEVLASMFDAVHRSALGRWARSAGKTDPLADLADGCEWVLEMVRPSAGGASGGASRQDRDESMIVAVLPKTAESMAFVDQLYELGKVSERPYPE
jgi:AcrR family transcriptional regulator